MKAIRELCKYGSNEKVWAGKYKNSHNLPHWHYDCELLYVEQGKLEVMCDKIIYTICTGDTFFINSEQVHYMRAIVPDTILTVIFFDYNLIKPFVHKTVLQSPLLSYNYGITDLYAKLKEELGARNNFYEIKTGNLITQLFIDIFRHEPTSLKPKEKTSTENFKKLLEEIDGNFEFYTFEHATEFMHMSPAYFSRAFHNETGMPFSKYLNYVKIDKAVEMLSRTEPLPITEVAVKCGFTTIRNFNRAFKEFTGYSPSNLPKDFVFNSDTIKISGAGKNPTLNECVLIECCNKV